MDGHPGGKGFPGGDRVCFRGGRRDRRVAAKTRLEPARTGEEPLPWSPKESLSPTGPMLYSKLGVGKGERIMDGKSEGTVE